MPPTSSSKKGKNESDKRDVFGRNIGYLSSCLPQLTHLDSIDLYSHELESGYSPLHVTLQRGFLRKSFLLYKRWKDEIEFLAHKFGGHVFNQVDREGLNPLEIYNMRFSKRGRRFPHYLRYQSDLTPLVTWSSDAADVSERVRFAFMELPKDEAARDRIELRGGSHLLTLGSNVNYQLGTGTADDRQNFFQLAIDQLNKSNTLELTSSRFRKVLVTRYHSIVLTTENKVYTCGNSSRGRLGNGVADVPQPKFSEILDLKETHINMIETSNHHTLLLTEDSDVYSWGWNGYGQLGYSTNNRNTDMDKVFGSVPKKISFLEGEEVVSISCSKIHSCAVTASGRLYMWGLNVGQLGGLKPVHKTPDTDYRNQNAYITSTPVIINCANSSIEQVVCTDFATFVRLQSNTLQVYTCYTTRSFKIPMPKSKSFKSVDAFAHFTPREISSKVVDMQCSNTFGNNIAFRYDCGRVGTITVKDESHNIWTKFSNVLPVTLCWAPNFDTRKCLDFAISSKGDLIVCAAGGEVFTTSGPSNLIEKMHSSRLITGRAFSVACDPSFVSFAILKDEVNEVPILYTKDRLLYDFSRYSPKYGVLNDMHTRITYGFTEFAMKDYLTNHDFLYKLPDDDDYRKKMKGGYSLADFEKERTSELSHGGTSELRDSDSSKGFDLKFCDKTTGREICKLHKIFLRSIVPWLVRNMLPWERGKSCIVGNGLLELSWTDCDQGSWTWAVQSADCDGEPLAEALREVVHYFYTDEKPLNTRASKFLLALLNNSYHTSSLPQTLHELLGDHCDRPPSETLDSTFREGVSTLIKERAHSTLNDPDTEIRLTDGVLYGHSLILRARSSFFEILFEQGPSSRDESCHIKVLDLRNFQNANLENFICVLKYAYGLPYNQIYCKIRKEHFSEKIQFLLDMLQLCDEMNLDYLKNYTEALVMKFINGETVVPILINARYSNSRLLARNCCWFICLHIGLLFSKENIDMIEEHFDSQIWRLLEETLREMSSKSEIANDKPWYNDSDVDWLRLFQTNPHAFNERFMDPERSFAPVIDLKTATSELKPTNRRKSSNQSAIKNRKPSFVNSLKVASVVEEKTSWKYPVSPGDSTAIDDSDEFIEVVKKSKRRTSSQSHSHTRRTESPPASQSSGKVVVHTSKENDGETLPSLLKQLDPVLDEITEGNTSAAKIKRSFKKGSQKQRLEKLSTEDLNSPNDAKKATWKSKPATVPKTSISGGSSVNHRKQSLPSLYDGNLAPAQGKKKREKDPLLSVGPSASNEVRSHGTWKTAAPYVPKRLDPEDPIVTQKKLSLEEGIAAQEFEKWFELESTKVQNQLKKDNKTVKDGFKAMYKAAEGMPEFLPTEASSAKKNGKKPRFKFQSKHKNKSQGTDAVPW